MKQKILFALLAVVCLAGCGSDESEYAADDYSLTERNIRQKIIGTWKCSGETITFSSKGYSDTGLVHDCSNVNYTVKDTKIFIIVKSITEHYGENISRTHYSWNGNESPSLSGPDYERGHGLPYSVDAERQDTVAIYNIKSMGANYLSVDLSLYRKSTIQHVTLVR